MTLALHTAPAPVRPRAGAAVESLSGWDVLAVALLLALWAGLFLVHYDALPMQLWDESRNANNALEMALHGRWLTPTYAGAVDNWNTKPPLLIWAMAGWLRLGLAPLLAVRVTSWLAAAATVAGVWGVLRFGLKDRLAAFAAGVMLLSAPLYIGPHAARTGDYDALESAFVLGAVLAFWAAFQRGRAQWLFGVAACLALGVLTKGVAALLPLPGLGLYALTRPRLFAALLRDVRTWAAAVLFAALVAGYYLSRESYDPGYLSAVAGNELGGRFLQITEHHQGSWHFYLRTLLQTAEPCALLAVLGFLPLFGPDPQRRSLVLASGLAAASLLLVLSVSRSKMEWYATPLTPLLSLIAGLGLTDGLGWLGARRVRWSSAGRGAVVAVLSAGALFGLWWTQTSPDWNAAAFAGPHLRYGEFLDQVLAAKPRGVVTIVDGGFHNDAGFRAYDPMLKFYAELAARRGLAISIVHDVGGLRAGTSVASCDPQILHDLQHAYRLQLITSGQGCLLQRVVGP